MSTAMKSCLVILFLIPSVAMAAATPSTLFCWKDLSQGLEQGTGDEISENPSLASSGGSNVWLTWAEQDSVQVRYREELTWKTVPGPKGNVIASHGSRIAVDAKGTPILMWIGIEQGQSSLFLARWNGREWIPLGGPLSAYPEPFTNAGYAVMMLDKRGLPVVVWQEAYGIGPRSLHAARWDGKQWRTLGKTISTGSDLYALEPSVALASSGEIYVAWVGGSRQRSFIQVSKWDGSLWENVGERESSVLQTKHEARMPQIVLRNGKEPFLVWVNRHKAGSYLSVAQLIGKTWKALPSPRQYDKLKESHAWAPALALSDDGVLLGWSENDVSGFDNIHVQLFRSDAWSPAFTRIHLDSGQSDAENPQFVATRRREFHVIWVEPDEREHRVRAIRAYPCGTGELPAVFPEIIPIETFWPKTVETATEKIMDKLGPESRQTLLDTPSDHLGRFNLSWGMGIRNTFGLWRGNTALLESCGDKTMEPDQCSGIIMRKVWEKVQVEAGREVQSKKK